MANDYYTYDGKLVPGDLARASQIAAYLLSIEAGFDKFPAPGESGGFTDPLPVGAATDNGHAAQLGQVKTWAFNVDAGGYKLGNLGAPAAPGDAVNKNYADTTFVALAGLAAHLPAGGYKITGLGAPTDSADSATKGYVDTQDALRVAKAGLDANLPAGGYKITGAGNATGSGDYVPLSQVNSLIAAASALLVAKSGMVGSLDANGHRITGAADAANPQDYVTLSQANALLLGGGSPGDIAITSLNAGTLETGGLITASGGSVRALSAAQARYLYLGP